VGKGIHNGIPAVIPEPEILGTNTFITNNVYKTYTFTSAGSIKFSQNTNVEVVIIGGGGGGGSSGSSTRGGAGAGGGGIVYFTYTLVSGTTYSFTVGGKGSKGGNGGGNTEFKIGTIVLATANGGNAGGAANASGNGAWAIGGTAVSGTVNGLLENKTIYFGGYGGYSGNGTYSSDGGSSSGYNNENKLQDSTTYMSKYSGGGSGCTNNYPSSAGKNGIGGSKQNSTGIYLNANATTFGSGGGGVSYNYSYGDGYQGACIICYNQSP